MTLSISERACILGSQVSFKPEHHGDEPVMAMDLKVSNIKIGEEELNILLSEPRASNILFNTREGGKFIEPVLRTVEHLPIKGLTKDVQVEFTIGTTVLKYAGCTMKSLHVELEQGGDASLSLSLRCLPPMRSELRLIERAGQEVRIALHAPKFDAADDVVPEEQGKLDLTDASTSSSRKKPKVSNGKHPTGRKRSEHRPGAQI